MPSFCRLADDLGLARNTVANAYGDLVAEGWLTTRGGSGTLVTDSMITRPAPGRSTAELSGDTCYDLIPGSPDLTAFPRAAWLNAEQTEHCGRRNVDQHAQHRMQHRARHRMPKARPS
ncbi:GntR family transcriptional regulator [Streptomyces sp. NPDC101237]|uniref:GntR family transcriptional regulator n=1 Tax=Streptomyces sp. NPDC101237 TaxID=3366139 RepID=UPI00381E8022